jgi:hypothetical protein
MMILSLNRYFEMVSIRAIQNRFQGHEMVRIETKTQRIFERLLDLPCLFSWTRRPVLETLKDMFSRGVGSFFWDSFENIERVRRDGLQYRDVDTYVTREISKINHFQIKNNRVLLLTSSQVDEMILDSYEFHLFLIALIDSSDLVYYEDWSSSSEEDTPPQME